MADAIYPSPNALYPQPPQPGQAAGLLGSNPLALINAASQINALRQQQAEFLARKAQGNALQNAIGPDGSIDPLKATLGVASNPDAALGAADAITSIQAAREHQQAVSTGQIGLAATQNQFLGNIISSLDHPGVTKTEVLNKVPTLARNSNIDSATINGWTNGLPEGGDALRTAIRGAGNAGMTIAQRATRVAGPPGPNGEPQEQPLGAANLAGTQPTGLSPAQAIDLPANQTAFNADQQKGAMTMANLRPMEQALPLIEKLGPSNFGPGSPELATLKGILVTAGIMDPNSTSLPTRQDAQKLLNQYVTQSPSSGRSDMALSQEKISRPNFDFTQPANMALIKNQIGMDKMDVAAPLIAKTGNGYLNFKNSYYQDYDPRAFGFSSLNKDEQASIQKSLGKPDSQAYKKFVKSYNAAYGAGMITLPPQASQ